MADLGYQLAYSPQDWVLDGDTFNLLPEDLNNYCNLAECSVALDYYRKREFAELQGQSYMRSGWSFQAVHSYKIELILFQQMTHHCTCEDNKD